jgi:hypothetical protein
MGRVIRAYQHNCTDVVERWGGHVAKYMGDGVLAYFGWPQAHEGEAERAVRAGLEVADGVAKLNTPAGETLTARVGIATGLVMVGELIGAGLAQEQTVVGETPNLAARLQALAEPGSVVIGQTTRRLTGGLFELTDLGPQRLKGFAEPVAAWRVDGKGRAEDRFEALHGERLTPLVGREHELGILLERWAWAKDGDGQVVLLSGEPGIGKSRVIRALRERLGEEPYTPLSHYCSPYHTNSALHPVIGLLERAARLDRDDPPGQRLARLEAVLARASDRLNEVAPLIAALLGIPTGERYPALSLTPEVQKRRTLQALVGQLAGLAAQQPVLALYEDVHWIDPSTLELLGLVIERIQRLPVLVLITFRPGFQPLSTGQAHVITLTVSRLGRRQGADLVGAGHRRQATAGAGRRADRGADRWRAAVCRGADQGGAGIGLARRRRRSLRAARRAAAARDPDHPSRLPDGAPGPLGAGQGGRSDRGGYRPRILPRAAGRGRPPRRQPASGCARATSDFRAHLLPWRATRGDLLFQTCAGAGHRLPVASQVKAPAAARAHR